MCDHKYIVSEWDGDVARVLMCQYCFDQIRYKDIRKRSKAVDAVLIDDNESQFIPQDDAQFSE